MCYCHNCKRYFHPLGIMSHRATHRRKQENCTITYSHGQTYEHMFAPSNKSAHPTIESGSTLPAVESNSENASPNVGG